VIAQSQQLALAARAGGHQQDFLEDALRHFL
jgi:hypothetical protein